MRWNERAAPARTDERGYAGPMDDTARMTTTTEPTERPATLGALRASGHRDRPLKEELRENLLAGARRAEPLFPAIVGYEDSAIPTLERGILAAHDLILLGERGQAKTRLIRAMVNLLDDVTPVVAGCEGNDHPYRPICARCRSLVASEGDATAIAWLPRDRR